MLDAGADDAVSETDTSVGAGSASHRASESRSSVPRVWLLTAHRAGDNTQVLALGEALGWPFEVKRFAYARWETLVNWPFSSTLAGVDTARSSPLGPPWPDLVITAGGATSRSRAGSAAAPTGACGSSTSGGPGRGRTAGTW